MSARAWMRATLSGVVVTALFTAAACGGQLAIEAGVPSEEPTSDAGSKKAPLPLYDSGTSQEEPPPTPPLPVSPPDVSPPDDDEGASKYVAYTCDGGFPDDPACGPHTSRTNAWVVTPPQPKWYPACPVAEECTSTSDGTSVHGSVIDCAGVPVANATVWTDWGTAGGSSGGGLEFCYASTTTDSAGQFVLHVAGSKKVDWGWSYFYVYVDTPAGQAVIFLDDGYACPNPACAIVVPR